MATLNNSYQYIGRTNAVSCDSGFNYYIVLYAKTSGDISTGKHTVSVQMYLACTSKSTFFGYRTNGSVTVDGASAFSWANEQNPNSAWSQDAFTVGGVTYKTWVLLKEGSVVVNTGYGASKDVVISTSWNRISITNSRPSWLPYTNVITAGITVTLPMIASASTITSASDVTLGNRCSVKWTPMAAAFYYKLGFQLGDWKYSTEVVHPNKTSEYTYTGLTIPLEVANQITNNPSGTMSVYLHTFTDSAGTNQIGDTSSATFKVTVPDNTSTKPLMPNMVLTAVNGDLPTQFDGMYIQGKSRVKWADGVAGGRYGANIVSYSMKVSGMSYDGADEYTSDYLSTYGKVKVTGYATDSRGYTGETQQEIDVIAYQDPKLDEVSALRCDDGGNPSESGTYLKIIAKRSYSPVVHFLMGQRNFCQIRYRYKIESNSYYSEWTTILADDDLNSDNVVTEPLLDGGLLATKTYRVEVQAVDDIGGVSTSEIIVPTDKVYWHKDGARNALGLGKYNEKEDALDSAWDFYMNNHKVTGLPTPEDDTDAVPLGLLRDYVVEQGESGVWTYRKWNSGVAECWGKQSGTVSCDAVWGSLYFENIAGCDFPEGLFVEAPVLVTTMENQNFFISKYAATAQNTGIISALSAVKMLNQAYSLQHIAKGRWK